MTSTDSPVASKLEQDTRTESRSAAERRLVRTAVLSLLAAAPVALGIGWLLDGPGGLAGAGAGLGLVGILFGGSILVLSVGARHLTDPGALLALTGLGFVIRLACYALVLVGLSQFSGLNRPAIAAGVAIGFVVTFAAELRTLTTTPRLRWLEPTATTGADRR